MAKIYRKVNRKTLIFSLVFLLGLGYLAKTKLAKTEEAPIYQTIQAQRGPLISSVSSSGVISTGSSNDISTKASGVVKEVYVKNGQKVIKGEKIATISLDDEALARQTIAYATYIDAVNNIKTAEKNKVTADIQMWQARQDYLDAQETQEDKNNNIINPNTGEEYTDGEKTIVDKTVEETKLAFSAAEAVYTSADTQINKARALAANAWRDYQKTTPVIVAPVAGIVNNLTLAPGVTIVSSTDTSASTTSGSVPSQKLGSIDNPNSQFQATVNLTEIDVIKVEPEQKVTLALDAYPDLTFTGKVLSIDTSGKVSSGVTSYPATILLDPTTVKIYPNMAVSAKVIIKVKNDVVLVPSSAIQTQNGQTIVRVIKDGEPTAVNVQVGDSNDTQTEIINGVNEGDEVVTSVITQPNPSSPFQGQNGSVFSGFGGANRSFGGGGAVIMRSR